MNEIEYKTQYNLAGAEETIEYLENQISILERAGELAIDEIEIAKDMLFECNMTDYAHTLTASWSYFKTKAKEISKSE